MAKKIFLIGSLLLLCFASSHLWADTGDGGYAGAFQRVGLGARALGMGGAFVGVADDATAGFFNPAGLVQIRMRTFGAFFRKMTLDRRVSYVIYCQPMREEATISLSWTNAGVTDVVGRNENGEITEEIKNYENAVELFFGRKIIKELAVGLRIGYIQYNLADINAYGVGFGLSAFGKPIEKLRVGAAVENLGMKYSWASGEYWKKFDLLGSSSKDEFPINLRFGASYLLLKDRILVSSEIDKNGKQKEKIHLGTEGWILEKLAARAGYDQGSLTLGMGLRQKMRSTILSFDYAYVSSRVGDDPDHLISFQLEF
jgi:rhodanese-related sulfurtransferase